MLPSLYYWEEPAKEPRPDSESGPGKRDSNGQRTD